MTDLKKKKRHVDSVTEPKKYVPLTFVTCQTFQLSHFFAELQIYHLLLLSLHKILLTLLLLAVSRKPVITKQMVSFTISLSVAQWLGRRTEVMGSSSVRESDIFLYPTHVNSRFIFHIYRPSLELTIFHYISPQKKFSTSNDLLRTVSK